VIDLTVVSAIIDIVSAHVKSGGSDKTAEVVSGLHIPIDTLLPFFSGSGLIVVLFTAYCALLVGIVGQTPGMLVIGLRVVRIDFGRPAFGQVIWRYVAAVLLIWLIVPLSFFSREFVHDRISGTRVIKTERVLARATA
jgi:uncharacterized RDD family membrane protein YckC